MDFIDIILHSVFLCAKYIDGAEDRLGKEVGGIDALLVGKVEIAGATLGKYEGALMLQTSQLFRQCLSMYSEKPELWRQ